ncbi:MAG TPA: maleylacetoacetate isomerase, partial [Pseudomonadales bacterium]|nr:maleylacetoacetate isomerase [Pseudomonadales bacterium]
AFAQAICCDIHPFNNIRVINHLRQQFGANDDAIQIWLNRWMQEGFESLEKLIEPYYSGQFCFGEKPTFADCCLIPQFYNAIRFNVPVNRFDKLKAIYNHCNTLDAFHKAAPQNQVDAEE